MHRVPTDSIEDEANMFGAELLVPEKELRRDLIGGKITLERLARLKAKWRVSIQFLLYQAGEIGCLTDYQSQYLWKQISRLGWRTREPADTDFAHENPQLIPKASDPSPEELGYELPEFVDLLRMDPNDLRQLYGIQDTSQRSFMHLVKWPFWLDAKHKGHYKRAMNRLSPKTRARILHLLCEGMSIRAITRLTGASKNTVAKLLIDAGKACAAYHDANVRNVKCRASRSMKSGPSPMPSKRTSRPPRPRRKALATLGRGPRSTPTAR